MKIETIRLFLETTYYVAAIVGIPVAIIVFIIEKRQERINREIDMYLQTTERYLQFLTLTFENPHIGCGDFNGDEEILIESGFSIQQISLFEILLITLEQCYYIYKKNGFNRGDKFGHVWLEYIVWWASRSDFRKAWAVIDPNLDPDFMTLMKSEFSKHE